MRAEKDNGRRQREGPDQERVRSRMPKKNEEKSRKMRQKRRRR